ncbi:MAG: glycine cleavage system protein GcvH [Bacteroidota bacterium]
MNLPDDLKYTKDHEWIRVDGETATIGITDYAQGELGDVVFVELPDTGKELKQGDSFGTIEAVKSVSDLYSPVSGTVTEVNGELSSTPELVNKDPYGKGWMVKIGVTDRAELESMLEAAAYRDLTAN